MNENILISQGMSYEYLKRLEEHSKLYDFVSDKKSFLRSIIPYEQKLVLLNSSDPYEVLNYLDELDNKATRKILNELTYDEIKKVISLFNSEDKKAFYSHYSDLDLVNQFIVHDKNASEYIDDLTFNRKVDLIDSSNSKTIEAASKVYETMSEEQQDIVSDFVTESSAVSTLSVVEAQAENNSIEEVVEENNSLEQVENNQVEQLINEAIEEKIEEKLEEQVEEKLEKEQQPELKEEKIEIKPEQKEEPLINEQEVVQELEINDEAETINLFQQEKQKNELSFINKIKNELISKEETEPVIENSNQKVI